MGALRLPRIIINFIHKGEMRQTLRQTGAKSSRLWRVVGNLDKLSLS
jgi:hypothetical protein